MSQSEKFCPKTSIVRHQGFSVPEVKICAIDIGYSSVKCFTDNMHACFPSLARQIGEAEFIGEANQNDILYREGKSAWVVGSSAIKCISLRDTNDSEATLYSRERYDSDMFKVIFRVGMALCLIDEQDIASGGTRPIVLQTGLPPAYLKSDKRDLIRSLAGVHLFEVKIGNGVWKEYCFELPADKIDVMAQPMGSLYSVSIDNGCRQIPEARQYFGSNLLVFDPGFGTCDTFVIKNRVIDSYESFNNLGMKAVYKRLSDKIYEKYGEYIPVHAISKTLMTGYIQVLDKEAMQTETYSINELVKECSEEICKKAIERLQTTYDYLREFRYLLITGGAGEAWKESVRKHFAGMQGLKIIEGNQNDKSLPQIFSNVRGYYLYQTGYQRSLLQKR